MNVDLPQPEGPITAVTRLRSIFIVVQASAGLVP